jgi:hypothetical protein
LQFYDREAGIGLQRIAAAAGASKTPNGRETYVHLARRSWLAHLLP